MPTPDRTKGLTVGQGLLILVGVVLLLAIGNQLIPSSASSDRPAYCSTVDYQNGTC